MFHAGERLSNALMELKINYKIDFEEVAKFIDIGYPMLTRYRKMKKFSPTVMHKIRYLEEMKVRDNFRLNPKHYEEEDEPRWIAAKGDDSEVTNEDILKEVDRLASTLTRYIETNDQILKMVLKIIAPNNKE